MAEVLPHPRRDRDFSRFAFDLGNGEVVVRLKSGDVISLSEGIGLLEQAKYVLMREASGDS